MEEEMKMQFRLFVELIAVAVLSLVALFVLEALEERRFFWIPEVLMALISLVFFVGFHEKKKEKEEKRQANKVLYEKGLPLLEDD